MSADTSWTRRYSPMTTGGRAWRSHSALGANCVGGEVLCGQQWISTDWIITANGDLHCPANRENSVVMLISEAGLANADMPVLSLALNTEYVFSPTRVTQIVITVDLSVHLTTSSTDDTWLNTVINGVAGPMVNHVFSLVLGLLSLGQTHVQRKQLAVFVPAAGVLMLTKSGSSDTDPAIVSAQGKYM